MYPKLQVAILHQKPFLDLLKLTKIKNNFIIFQPVDITTYNRKRRIAN